MYPKCLYRNHNKNKYTTALLVCIGLCMLVTLSADAKSNAQSSSLSNKVFTLSHIPAHQAKKILVDLSIGRDINCMAGDSVLLFTADNQADMDKATVILNVIDSKLKYRSIPAAIKPNPASLPNIEQLNADIDDLTIGTFEQFPANDKGPAAILGMHNSNLIIIAPENRVKKIKTSILRNWKQKPLAEKISPPQEPKALPGGNISEDKSDFASEKLLLASETATFIKSQPELETFSKSLGQSTGPKSQPDERELEVVITVGDKQKTTHIKDGRVIGQFESIVEETATAKEKPEFEPLDDELFAELMKTLEKQGRQQPPVNAPEIITEPEIEVIEEIAEPEVEVIEEITEPEVEVIEEVQEPNLKEIIEAMEAIEAATIESIKEEKKPVVEHESLQPKKAGIVTIPLNELLQMRQEPQAPIQVREHHVAIPAGEEELETTITLPTEVAIINLLELVGKQLGINYMYDPIKLKNSKVMLKIHDGKIKVKDLYALVESVLRFKKLATTRRGNLVTIVPETEVTTIDPIIREDVDDIQPGDIVVATIFKLNHISTGDAIALLRNMKLSLSTQPIEQANTLIVTGYAHRMPRVAELLKMVDVEGEPRKFAFRTMIYTTAEVMASKVETLASQLGTVQVSIAATASRASTPKPIPGRTARPPISRTTAKPTAAKGKDSVYLDVDERTNRILMIGLIKDLLVINELIDSLDVPKRDPRHIVRYDIKHVEADEVVSTLNAMGIISYSSSGSRSSSSRTRTTARPTTTSAKSASTAGPQIIPGEEPLISLIESTNSLLVNATDEQHDQIVAIIEHVDRELEDVANPFVIYKLENKTPEEMATVLEKVVSASMGGGGSRGRTTSANPKVATSASTTGSGPLGNQEDIISIVPDESTFSLIVYASKKNQEQIGRMIKELDKRRPQVLIDVTLVEIFKNEQFQYDLELVTAVPDLIAGDVISPGLSLFGTPVNVTQGYKSTGDTFTAFYADNHIQSLLTLMQTKEYGRVLSQPKLLVNDGEAGVINQEKTIYIARKSQSTNTNSGQSITDATTTFDSFPSGITMTITPNIGEGDLLRLEIELNRSQQDSPDKVETDTPPPDKKQQDLSTIVTVPDKSTIILGGINELSQSKDTGKIPILGDIPIFGILFQNQVKSDKQAHLYVFVKAYILRPKEGQSGLPELTERSNEYRSEYEIEEKQFQDHNWGSIKKTDPILPMKILKDDE